MAFDFVKMLRNHIITYIVELQVTVNGLNALITDNRGYDPDWIELIHWNKLLSHQEAPVAAYFWVSWCTHFGAWQRPP